MIHTDSLDALTVKNAWLTIGIFDGVHRGHQTIIRRLVEGAHSTDSPAVVLTFNPHPAVVLGGKTDFKFLTTPEERLALLESVGVDFLITQKFDREFANQTASDFMTRVSHFIGLKALIVGYDTALGRGREGDAARLTEIGKSLGYTVEVVQPLRDQYGIISSTRIRLDVLAGKVQQATAGLGRPYSITGQVVHGVGRGHSINIPTANIQIPSQKVFPAYGIYACRAWVDGTSYPAATSLGVRPTFYTSESPAPTIEAHLLNFDRNIYGRQVTLEFIEFLRPEEKYTSIPALIEQIQKDILNTRQIVTS